MAFTAGYPAHPTHFFPYAFRTPPQTPQSSGDNIYYSPRHYPQYATPPRGHNRRATGDHTTFTFTAANYSTPRKTSYNVAPDFSSPSYRATAQSTPQRKSDYVSGSDRKRESTRSYRVSTDRDGKKQQRQHSTSKHYSSRSRGAHDEPSDVEYEYLPRYEPREPSPPSYRWSQTYPEPRADRRNCEQVPIYTADESAQKSRPRRASYTAKPSRPATTRRPSTATKPPPQATEEDARQHGIPAGFSIKNWDPTEEPILLLGSVFDANSLGKWIYDWTVYSFGAATPMTDVAGEMWLLLIQLAGKVKRAEECMSRIRQKASRHLVQDFLESGDRLWERFTELLKKCEKYMWKAARKESRDSQKVKMGNSSGCEFVDSLFGRDRELDKTEKLMASMRMWSWRFDVNCEEILKNPSA